MNIAFVHLMKTAGSTVDVQLAWNTLYPKGIRLENSWIFRQSDWSPTELTQFCESDKGNLYVHNHGGGWPDEILTRYIQKGWFTFCFYRHPGDQWCSFYHWGREMMDGKFPSIAHDYELDEFLRLAWSDELNPNHEHFDAFQDLRNNLDLPRSWRDMSYVGVYSDQLFQRFLKTYFNSKSDEEVVENKSSNRGYDFYRNEKHISDQTHDLLLQSDRYRDFLELEPSPLVNEEPFVGENDAVFYAPKAWKAEPPVRYAIIVKDRLESQFLSKYLEQHPLVNHFDEVLETFKQKPLAQMRWLKTFFLKLPETEPTIRCLGFLLNFQSMADPERFKTFFEKHGIKLVCMRSIDPKRLALSEQWVKNDGRPFKANLAQLQERITKYSDDSQIRNWVDSIKVPRLEFDDREFVENQEEASKTLREFLDTWFVEFELNVDDRLLPIDKELVLNKREVENL